MYDLISKKSLLSAYDEKHKGPAGGARKLIEDAPSIPAVPLDKLCEWLEVSAHNGVFVNCGLERMKDERDILCSVCGARFDPDIRFLTDSQIRFCPHCGAKVVKVKWT